MIRAAPSADARGGPKVARKAPAGSHPASAAHGATSVAPAVARSRAPADVVADRAAAAVATGGRPLPTAVRAYFEPRYGVALAGVRVHDHPAAGAAARAMGAEAYALGRDVAFAPGRYDARSPSGLLLLGHELAHVAQTRSGPSRAGGSPAGPSVGGRDDPAERDAERMTEAALTGARALPGAATEAGVIRRFAAPIPLPDRTYVARQDPEGDGFLNNALIFHRQWGLNPVQIDSLQDVVDDLKAGAGRIGRIRIVTHAGTSHLHTALFENGPDDIYESELRGFSADREAGVSATLYGRGWPGLAQDEAVYTGMLEVLRRDEPAPLRPFGLDAGPLELRGAAGVYFRRAVDLLLYQSAAVSTADRQVMAGVRRDMDARRAEAAAERLPGGGRPTAAQLDALRDAVLRIRTQGVQLDRRLARGVGAAETAIERGFYADLRAVRARFDASSRIDLRGCRIGGSVSYMRAVAGFFGRADALPHVSAPQWFQAFPSLGAATLTPAQIPAAVEDPAVLAAINRWFEAAGLLERARWAHGAWLQLAVSLLAREVGAMRLSLGRPPPLLGGLRAPDDPTAALPPLRLGGTEPLLRPDEILPTLTAPQGPAAALGPRPGALARFAEIEAERLHAEIATILRMSPAEKLAYYLGHDLLLPVLGPRGDANEATLFALRGRGDEALRNWLGSMWAADPPGLAQLRGLHFQNMHGRRVEAMEQQRRQMVEGAAAVAPDPAYLAHLTEI
jgi:hypothetical protein